MAYNNRNCNPCSGPIPPACVEGPPECEGTPCAEIYPAECTIYNGPEIPNLGITSGMSINEILMAISENICNCENENGDECIHPVRWFLKFATDIYNINIEKETDIELLNILGGLLDKGIMTSNCDFCCPDYDFYGLVDSITYNTDIIEKIDIPINEDNYRFTECAGNDFTDIEIGTINNESSLCVIKEYMPKSLISSLAETGLFIACMNNAIAIVDKKTGISMLNN